MQKIFSFENFCVLLALIYVASWVLLYQYVAHPFIGVFWYVLIALFSMVAGCLMTYFRAIPGHKGMVSAYHDVSVFDRVFNWLCGLPYVAGVFAIMFSPIGAVLILVGILQVVFYMTKGIIMHPFVTMGATSLLGVLLGMATYFMLCILPEIHLTFWEHGLVSVVGILVASVFMLLRDGRYLSYADRIIESMFTSRDDPNSDLFLIVMFIFSFGLPLVSFLAMIETWLRNLLGAKKKFATL